MGRSHRISAGLVALSLMLSGCYGPFNLTKRLYWWNGAVGDKWENEVVFLLLLVVPAYGVASLADAVIFNSMEFWTGTNPVNPPQASDAAPLQIRRITRGSDQVVLTRLDEAQRRTLTVALLKDGRETGTLRFGHRVGGPTSVEDAQGRVLMSAQVLADGKMLVTNNAGQQVARYTADEVERLTRSIR